MNRSIQIPQSSTNDSTVACVDTNVGQIFLNRPKALNSLDEMMVKTIREALQQWRQHSLRAVFISSSRSSIFCAGGDVKAIKHMSLEGRADAVESFFAHEYQMNSAIADHETPIISLIDGVCLGAPPRIVGDRGHESCRDPQASDSFYPDGCWGY
ncbi:enoyl-CoA hydratase/isomerase family protein [Brevibacterium sp. CFH 10365]|uniref:enoyl-CoA hydratase/isomerase family protein n=1 Tax=Brevibacterium sp. CFH 10365 TaxID=2585207 RepID=UPI0012662773|nr:enoyl-CoA hydratase/isomerase family protein [Brevibacterium sp. CFH 10365]